MSRLTVQENRIRDAGGRASAGATASEGGDFRIGQTLTEPARESSVVATSGPEVTSSQGKLTSVEDRIPLAPDSAMSGALERRCDSSGMPEQQTFRSPPDCCSGSSVYLWCPECQEVVDEPGSRDCGGLLCDVCNSNLVDTHGCVDCGKAVGSPEDDWCIGCLAQWAARERADELTAVLVDIAMTPWTLSGVSHG